MAKLKGDPVKERDLLDYLNSYSDFSFELRVLKMLRDNGLDCEHGGLYTDPVTGKSREFDIRAAKTLKVFRVRLAVECKNIRANFPVLISCVPRHPSESYHEIAWLSEPKRVNLRPPAMQSRAKVLRLTDNYSIYKSGNFVGKSIAQVGRLHDDTILANDNELFDKWSQALSSADDLSSRMYWDGNDEIDKQLFSTVVPIVIVPDGILWSVHYDTDGNMSSGPSQVTRCPCFIDKTYKINTIPPVWFDISHIEIMTYSGLHEFVTSVIDNEEHVTAGLFPPDGLIEAVERSRRE
jgi:hypothetical protein